MYIYSHLEQTQKTTVQFKVQRRHKCYSEWVRKLDRKFDEIKEEVVSGCTASSSYFKSTDFWK